MTQDEINLINKMIIFYWQRNEIPNNQSDFFLSQEISKKLILTDVVKPFYCYCYEHSAKDEKCKTLCEDCKVYN